MNSKEFIKAVDAIVKEKNIDREYVFEAMELALATAYKKNFDSLTNSKIFIDRKTGDIKVYSYLTVVDDDAEDPDLDTEITLSEARKINKTLNVGDTIDTEVTPKDFGRVAAATAKQVIIQKMREAERNAIMDEFGDKQDELLVGTVALEDVDNYFIDLGRTNGILPKKECIPGEKIEMGKQIKVYVSKVDNSGKGLFILLSRNHYGFVKRLFELEIPEFASGNVLMYAVAREAGVRSKVAVYSEKPNFDPIGACIGEKGVRIASIIKELKGEKIDLVKYDKDPKVFIENAMAPAKNITVLITDPKKNEAMVFADKENFSLAIGKKGINIKLASKLTRYKLNIKTLDDINKEINK